MAARKPHTPQSNESTLVTGLVCAVIALVAILIFGGYWMQKQRDQETLRMQADVYDSYLHHTRPAAAPKAVAPAVRSQQAQAQETRKYLLAHPAVTPGAGFDQPGVQTSGKTIVDAIDQARGL